MTTDARDRGADVKITDDDRVEAARLSLLPRAVQREVVAIIGAPADDPRVKLADRQEARRRSAALIKLLKMTPKRK